MSSGFGNNDDVRRVRDATDIVAVIGEHLAITPKGREYKCLCPFHDDHNPSMSVVPSKQIYHCFVCGAGGDVFRFVMDYHSMGFREALEHLAQRVGVELTPYKPSRGSESSEHGEPSGPTKSDIIEANGAAQGFFRAILAHPEHGKAARELVERRGISAEMVERFGIGAAPDRWDGLLTTANKKGLDERTLLGAGLLKQRDNGGLYDALRNRLIFPIRDQIGRPIAFGARRINDEDEPKYLNSPETSAFNKSSTLFGLDLAAQAIKKERVAVIVEGYTDVIACHQHGVTNVVATLGTALTNGHATILRRLCDTVVLLFDGDDAGQRAADRAIEVLLSETIDIKIAALAGVTDAKDPDELLAREGGRALFEQAIREGRDLLEWKFDRLRAELSGQGPAAITQRIEDEVRRIAALGIERLVPVRRRLLIKQIADAAGVEPSDIHEMIKLGRRPDSGRDEAPLQRGPRRMDARDTILGCLLCEPALWSSMSDSEHDLLSVDRFVDERSARVMRAVFECVEDTGEPSLTNVLDFLAQSGAATSADDSAHATALHLAADPSGDADRERLGNMLRQSMETLVHSEERARRSDPEGEDPIRALEILRQRRKSDTLSRGSLNFTPGPER